MFKTVATTEAHTDSIWTTAWSKAEGNEHIVTGSVDGIIKTWSFHASKSDDSKKDSQGELKQVHKMEGHSLGIVSIGLDPTGNTAVSSSLDSHLKFWDLETGKETSDIEPGPVNAFSVAFNPKDGTTVAAGSNTGDINIYDKEQGKRVVKLNARQRDFAMSLNYSTDGGRIASGSMNGGITIFDLTTGANGSVAHYISNAHTMPVRSVCFSPEAKSNVLFTACDDSTIKIFDTREAGHVGTISGHASWVLSVVCSPDGTSLATGSSDKTMKIWDLRQRDCKYTSNAHDGQVWSVAYNRDGSLVSSVSDDKKLCVTQCP